MIPATDRMIANESARQSAIGILTLAGDIIGEHSGQSRQDVAHDVAESLHRLADAIGRCPRESGDIGEIIATFVDTYDQARE